MASIEEAEILLKLPSLEVDTSTVEVRTADLPVIDIDSVLLKAAVRLFYFHKRRETYKYPTLDHSDYAIVCYIIKKTLADKKSNFNDRILHDYHQLYNEEGRSILRKKAPINLFLCLTRPY